VELNLGVAILPERIFATSDGTLAAVRIQGEYEAPSAVICKKGKVLSLGIKHFIELLKKPS
jgi:hypothetical protein